MKLRKHSKSGLQGNQNNPRLAELGQPYRFKPGFSGNPGGRPLRNPISDRYAELVNCPVPEEERAKRGLPEGSTWGDIIAQEQVLAAARGRTEAIREIREAIEGKVMHRMSNVGKREITLKVEYEKPRETPKE